MDKKLNFSSGELLNHQFKSNVKGYDPDEVDAFLDKIIEDYREIESRDVSNSKGDLKALNDEIERLKDELEKEQARWKYISKDPRDLHIDNYELLKRIGKLEMYIKDKLNINPDEIK